MLSGPRVLEVCFHVMRCIASQSHSDIKHADCLRDRAAITKAPNGLASIRALRLNAIAPVVVE
jgi:hypothetical protein